MKKRILISLIVLSICFAGCSNNEKQPVKPDNETVISQNDTEKVTQEKTENEPEGESEVHEEKKPEIILVDKAVISQCEWYEDTPSMLAKSDYSYVLLNEKDSEKYPALASALTEVSDMCKRSMNDEFDNLVSFAKEELEMYDGFTTEVSKLDTHVRRADSTAFSVLSDSYLDTANIFDFRAFHGTNYDTQTGKELVITDVISDMSKVPEIVEELLTSHMWGGDYLSDTAVKDYFENTPTDGISWSLEYNGITLYFNKGDIAEPEYGHQSCTITFDEYPEIFNGKYISAPDSYTVKLPLSTSNYFDFDDDAISDEFIVAADFDEIMGCYSYIYLIKSENIHEESICAYGFNPYYVKTADGRHLLYLFIEGTDSWHRLMNLYVYDIGGKTIEKIDEIALAPHHDVDSEDADVFTLPTDPNNMYFDYFVNEDGFFYPSFAEYHTVGSDGLPEMLGDGIMMDYPMDEDMG